MLYNTYDSMLLLTAFHICVQIALTDSMWLLLVFQICFQSMPWMHCIRLLLTIMMAITTRNKIDVEQMFEISEFQAWCGAQNFSFNLILEFLELADVVKLLTIVHSSQPKFIPTSTLLSEILRKALLFSLLAIPFYSIDRKKRPTLLMISKDKTLTLHTMHQLYDFIKESISSEYEPCIAKFDSFFQCITSHDELCTIWSHAGQGEDEWRDGLSFKMIFASSQCSDRECNQIVLWHCGICESPCSECAIHVTLCDFCYETACTDCLVTDNLCKDCGFICVECEGLFIAEEVIKFICEGSECGCSCPIAAGPYCSSCAWPEDRPVPHISFCCRCCRMACMECDIIMWCETCKDQYCYECMPPYVCYVCTRMICDICEPTILHCKQV
jgi:hypothetical protein